MANTIEAAEMIESNIVSLEKALETLTELKDLVGMESTDQRIIEMKELIKQNKETAEYIRKTAE